MSTSFSFFQIVVTIIAIGYLTDAVVRFSDRQRRSFSKLLLTFAVWAVILIFSLSPQVTHRLSNILGFGQNLNTLIFLGFVVTFVIIFKIYGIQENAQRQITSLVRQQALEPLRHSLATKAPAKMEDDQS